MTKERKEISSADKLISRLAFMIVVQSAVATSLLLGAMAVVLIVID